MKRLFAAGLVALLLVAVAALVALGESGDAASTAQYQYGGRQVLKASILVVTPSYYIIRVSGTNYFGSQPGGQLRLTCDGKRGSPCGPTPEPWPAGPVDESGRFSFDFTFDCGSNVRFAVAVDNNGVKSSPVQGAC